MKMFSMCSTLIPIMLAILIVYWVEKKSSSKEKKTPFECGFNPIFNKKMMFSTNFIMLTMMFLVFDMEIFILIPLIMQSKNTQKMTTSMSMIFVVVLTVLMFKEWKQGSLEWSK